MTKLPVAKWGLVHFGLIYGIYLVSVILLLSKGSRHLHLCILFSIIVKMCFDFEDGGDC
jgi:hypothetical protein